MYWRYLQRLVSLILIQSLTDWQHEISDIAPCARSCMQLCQVGGLHGTPIPWHSVTARLPSCPLLFCVQLDLSKWHGHFGTLMPFYRAWSTAKPPPSPLPEPKAVPVMPKDPSAL